MTEELATSICLVVAILTRGLEPTRPIALSVWSFLMAEYRAAIPSVFGTRHLNRTDAVAPDPSARQ